MSNPLRFDDPEDQFPPDHLISEVSTGTRHPNRMEPHPSSPNTQAVREDAARVYRNAALSVATGATVSWDSKVPGFDTTGIWNGSTTFTIPATGYIAGVWKAKAQITWPGTGAGVNRQIEIRKNGVVMTTKFGPANTITQDIEDDFNDPSRGDLFTITIVHDAGGSLALAVGSDKTFFSMIHTG